MRTNSTLFSEFSNEFSKNLLRWITANSEKLEKSFSKKYPLARNRFNVQVRNTNGSKRILVLNALGEEKVDITNSYKNVLPWQTVRRLGCPAD